MNAIANVKLNFAEMILKNNCPHDVIEPISQKIISAGETLVVAVANQLEKAILCRFVAMMNAMSNDCIFIQEK